MRNRVWIGSLGLAMLLPAVGAGGERVPHHGAEVDVAAGSRTCLECHDGSAMSRPVTYCTVDCGFADSHAIDKDYPPPGREAEFVPLDAVNRGGVRLDQGKITCVSCHDLKNGARHHLALSNAGSGLCLTCHIK